MKTRIKLVALAVMSTSAAFAHGEGLEDRIKFNGFMSVGVSRTEEPATYNRVFDNKNWSTRQETRMGLQALYSIDDQTSVTSQLVARASEDYRAQMEWAYLTRKVTDSTTVRFGRMRTPFYLYSESLEVGVAYPWTRPPEDVYNVPVSSFTGADVRQNFEFGDWTGSVGAFTGNSQQQRNFLLDATVDFRNVLGINANISRGDFTFRAGYAGADFTMEFDRSAQLYQDFNAAVKAVLPAGDSARLDQTLHGEFGGVGFQYDDGSLLFTSEVTNLKYTRGVFDGRFGAYATLGYRFGKFTPFFTYGKYYSTADSSDERKKRVAAALRAKQTALNTQFTASLPNTGLISAVQDLAASYRQIGDQSQSTLNQQMQLEIALKGALTTAGLDPIAPNPQLLAVANNINCESYCLTQLANPTTGLSSEVRNYIQGHGTTLPGADPAAILDSVATEMTSQSASLTKALDYFGDYPQQTTYTVGFRYDLTNRVALKAQTTLVTDMNGTHGLFDKSIGEKGRLYSLVIDATF